MANSLPGAVIIKQDRVDDVIKAILGAVGSQVLVGIPAAAGEHDNAEISNAALGYIHEFGSPSRNIPARAFLIPGVKDSTEECARELKWGMKEVLAGRPMTSSLHRAGHFALNSVRAQFYHNNWVELQPQTVAQRYRQRGTKTRRANEKAYLLMISQGAAPDIAQAIAGIRPLMNTLQLFKSITYVVRQVGSPYARV